MNRISPTSLHPHSCKRVTLEWHWRQEVTCTDSHIHGHSLDLSLGLHEDKFPLPGESPLQPGEVFLEEPIRRGVRGQGYLNSRPLDDCITHSLWWRAITLDYCYWDETTSHDVSLNKLPNCCYHTVFAVSRGGTIFVRTITELISVITVTNRCILKGTVMCVFLLSCRDLNEKIDITFMCILW